jgi:rare lipoprotein A
MMWGRTAGLVLGLVLSGCAPTKFAVHRPTSIAAAPAAQPGYKVGSPYQVNGVWYYPAIDYNYDQTGIASWYGPGFVGQPTASGEVYDDNGMTAAHKTLPMPTLVRVTNLENGRQIQIRINDRGPFVNDRIIDLSRRSAQLLGMEEQGTARVRVQVMAEESRQLALALGAGEEGVPQPTAAPAPKLSTQSLASLPAPASAPMPVAPLAVAPQPAPAAPKPVVPATAAPQPVAPVWTQPVVTTQTLASVPAPQPARVTPTTVLSAAPLPQPSAKVVQQPVHPTNIFIQAGAFLQVANAEHLKDSLSQLVATARVIPVQLGAQKFYRVRLGPIATVDQADQMLDQVIAMGHKDARIVVE